MSTEKIIDPNKMTAAELAAHNDALQNGLLEPLAVSVEVFDVDGPTHAPKPSKSNGLPADEPLRRSLTDTDLIVSESTGRQFRRQWDADRDGVEVTGSETWLEITRQGASEVSV